MIEKDNIKDLFAKGLQDHHVQVDPALWTSISSSIGAGTAKTGLGLLSKTLIGVAASSVIAVAVYFSVQVNSKTESTKIKALQKNTKERIPSQEPAINNSNETIGLEETQVVLNQLNTVNIPGEDTILDVLVLPTNPNPIQNRSVVPSTLIPHSIPVIIPTQTQVVQTVVPAPTSATQTPVKVVPNQLRVALPNIFTPNNDGQNETLQIDWNQNTIEDFSIVVLNKENQVVFSSSNPYFDWDGSDLGSEKLARGGYIYFVAGMPNGQKWQQSSSLQIQY
jgi:gliding motility-associated-like protein